MARPSGIGSGGPNGLKHVVIVGGTEETRLLLRGLVRLHHHRVVAEGPSPDTLQEIPPEPADPILLIDADLGEARWAQPIGALLGARPTIRAILITASRSPQVETQARGLGVSQLLHRPFAVHELVEALDLPAGGPEPPAGPSTGSP